MDKADKKRKGKGKGKGKGKEKPSINPFAKAAALASPSAKK